MQGLATALFGNAPQSSNSLPPVPTTGPYGAPAVTREGPPQGQQVAGPAIPSSQSEDPTIAGYRGLHDDAIAVRRQALAAADRAAAAGIDPSDYLKIADQAHKEAYELKLKAIEYKPTAPPATVSPGTGVYNLRTGGYDVPLPKEPGKADTSIVHLNDGTFQTINNAPASL